MIIAVCNLCMG